MSKSSFDMSFQLYNFDLQFNRKLDKSSEENKDNNFPSHSTGFNITLATDTRNHDDITIVGYFIFHL